MVSLVPMIALAPQGPSIFDQSIAAFKARRSFSVTIGLDASLQGRVTKEHYKLSYLAPNKVLLLRLVNNQTNLAFWLNGGRFLAYDPSAREMVVRKAPTKGPIVNRLANAMGGIEDPVSAQLSPSTMAAFLTPFKGLSGWSPSRTGDTVLLTRTGSVNGKQTLTKMEFSAKTKLLERALLLAPGSRLEWRFAYHPTPKTLSFAPPKGTRTVEALAAHVRVPTADPRAKNIVDRCIRSYGRLNTVSFSVNGTGGASTNWKSGSSFRSKQTYLDWSYHRGILTIRDIARKRSYRGKCKPAGVTTALHRLQRPMDPVLQALLMNKNPVDAWFTTGTKITTKGQVSVGGGHVADALEMNSDTLQVSLLIRRDNNLVHSVTSRGVGPDGKVISRSSRDFTYWLVNKPLPPSTFAVSVTSPLPLSRIGR